MTNISRAAQARADYRRELQRINRELKTLAKEGRAVPQKALPRIIKTPTAKSVERLKSVKGRELRKISQPLAEILGAVPTADPYKLPPTEKQLSKLRKAARAAKPKQSRKPKRAKTAPEPTPEVEEVAAETTEDETPKEELPERWQIIKERLREPIARIKVDYFRTSLLDLLGTLTPLELVTNWDLTDDSDRQALDDIAGYINVVYDNLTNDRRYSQDQAISETMGRTYHKYKEAWNILSGTAVPADIARAANDIIMGV